MFDSSRHPKHMGTRERINLIEWLTRGIDASRPRQVEGDATLLQVNGSGYYFPVLKA
jgi:hypothetical protein